MWCTFIDVHDSGEGGRAKLHLTACYNLHDVHGFSYSHKSRMIVSLFSRP